MRFRRSGLGRVGAIAVGLAACIFPPEIPRIVVEPDHAVYQADPQTTDFAIAVVVRNLGTEFVSLPGCFSTFGGRNLHWDLTRTEEADSTGAQQGPGFACADGFWSVELVPGATHADTLRRQQAPGDYRIRVLFRWTDGAYWSESSPVFTIR
ncbi:MAG: hypothetical protein GTO22_20775 [Gemmatimonadales bacterium]|nr:hypothetical protein [Gemmatimonadales bacterium]